MTTYTNVLTDSHNPLENIAPYGYCPKCGSSGQFRERRLNGNDACVAGHTYKSSVALKSRPYLKHKEEQK